MKKKTDSVVDEWVMMLDIDGKPFGEGRARRTSELSRTIHRATRPATMEEIDAELKRRDEEQIISDKRRAFREREEYEIAHKVRSLIECMEYDDHPLDNLTVDEWRDLYERLRHSRVAI